MTTGTAVPTEDRVKAAAVRLFGSKGFAGTGIREIANGAGISIASLYHYMDTKESLLLSLMLDGMQSLLTPAVATLEPEEDPVGDLIKLVKIHITFHCEQAALARVTDAELRSLSPASRRRIIDMRDSYEALWMNTITRGQKSGLFKVAEPRLATLALLEMCTGVSHWYSPGGRCSADEIARIYSALALRLLDCSRTATIRRLETGLPADQQPALSGKDDRTTLACLDPQVQDFAQRQRQLGFAAYHVAGAAAARESSRAVTQWRQGLARRIDRIASVKSVAIPSVAGALEARIYRPVTAPIGIVTYFHGGGFVVGDLDTCEAHCRALCARSDCVVVNVDYRLAPEARFPAALHDAYAAARWTADHLVADLPHVLAGDSAGGNLAATTAVLARDTGFPRLAGQLLIYPMLDPTMSTQSIRAYGDGYMLDAPTLEWFWSQYLGDPGLLPVSLLATPLDLQLAGVPPALVVTAELDPLRDEGKQFAQRLAAAGVQTKLWCFPSLLHGFFGWASYIDAAESALSEVCASLKELFVAASQ